MMSRTSTFVYMIVGYGVVLSIDGAICVVRLAVLRPNKTNYRQLGFNLKWKVALLAPLWETCFVVLLILIQFPLDR